MLGLPQILVSKCSFFLKCRLILLELGKENRKKSSPLMARPLRGERGVKGRAIKKNFFLDFLSTKKIVLMAIKLEQGEG